MKTLKKNLSAFFHKFWPIAFIVIAVCVFFYPVLFKGLVPIPGDFIVGTYFPWLDYKWGTIAGVPVKNPITSDVVSVIFPIKSLVIDAYKTGQLPLWNSYMFGGYPLLANFQAAVFSPTMLVYLLFNKLDGWTIQIILQPILSSIFFYLMLRHFRLKQISSVFGGLVYAFAGFSVIWLEWNAHALVAAWIPLIILLVDKLITEKKNIFGLFLSFAIGMQILSGYPQLIIYTFLATFVLIWFKKGFLSGRVLLKLIIFILLGMGISCIQLIPSAELFGQSQRGSEILAKDITFLPYQNLITFLAPDFFGNHATGNFWGIGNYTNNVGYTGLVTFSVALFAVFSLWKRKEVKYFLLLFILSLLISLENPITDLISSSGLLGLSALSNTRALILANFSLAGLFALGIDRLLESKNEKKIYLFLFPIFIILTSGGYLIISKIHNYKIAFNNLFFPLCFSVLTFLLMVIWGFSNRNVVKKLLIVFIGILAIAELFRFGWKYTPFSKAQLVFPETPIIKYLETTEKPMRFDPGKVIPMNFWVPYGLESISGYDAAYPASISKYISVINSGNVNASPQGRQGNLGVISSPLLNLSGNDYSLILKSELTNKNLNTKGLVKVFEDKSVIILKNQLSLPRAFFVNNWEINENRASILEKLMQGDYSNGKKIILQNTFNQFSPDGAAKGDTSYKLDANGRIEIDANVSGNGFIFISNTYYPGWKLKVDGIDKKIYQADYAFMAIPVTRGNHILELYYEPESLKIGTVVSVLCLLTLFILCYILSK